MVFGRRLAEREPASCAAVSLCLVRGHRWRRPPVPGQNPRQCGQDQSVARGELRPRHLTSQYRDLMAKDRDLDVLLIRCRTETQGSEDSPNDQEALLTLACPDRPRIVQSLADGIAEIGGNILDSAQFSDPATGTFCVRTQFEIGMADPAPMVSPFLEHGLAAGLGSALKRSFEAGWGRA